MSQPATSAPGKQAEEDRALWNLIPLDNFKPPASAAPEAVRSGLADLWRRLRGRDKQTEASEAAVEMERPSQKLLDWAAPSPDWSAEDVTGLHSGLCDWLEADPQALGIQTIVDAPISVVRARLEKWAVDQGYFLVTPPTPEQILRVDRGWLDALPLDKGQRLLLPRLERCFLRHHNGLELLRRLLERIDRDQPHGRSRPVPLSQISGRAQPGQPAGGLGNLAAQPADHQRGRSGKGSPGSSQRGRWLYALGAALGLKCNCPIWPGARPSWMGCSSPHFCSTAVCPRLFWPSFCQPRQAG